ALKKHGAKAVVGFEESHRWVPVPKTQALDLVLSLHVRHAKFEHRGGSVRAHRRRHPGTAHFVTVKRCPERERPSALQLPDSGRQPLEPGSLLPRLAAV